MILFLKVFSLSIQVILVAQVLAHMWLPFQFGRWRSAWVWMLAATGLMTGKRIHDLWNVTDLSEVSLNIATSFALLCGFWNLRMIFATDLSPPSVDPIAHIVIDQHSQIQAWDATATRLFGWTSTDAIGRTLMQTIMCPRDWEAHRAGMARYLAVGDEGRLLLRTYAVMALHKDGRELPFEVTIRAVPTADPLVMQFAAELRALVHL